MNRKEDKWFSVRTDFYSRDAYVLNFFLLSPAAMALYMSSIAYACKWGIDYAFKSQAQQCGIKRPAAVIRELVEHGFWYPIGNGTYGVCHEGILWRRGTPLSRRPISPKLRAAVMERDNFACVNCASTVQLTLDHIWPYSKGGEDTLENLRVLCRSCNSAKGARV